MTETLERGPGVDRGRARRVESDAALEIAPGLGVLVEGLVGEPARQPDVGVRGLELDRAREVEQRLARLPAEAEGLAASEPRVGVARIDLRRPGEVGEREVRLAPMRVGDSAVLERGGRRFRGVELD